MMGSKGLTDASKIAILNANYMVKRLEVINLSLIRFLAVNDDYSMWPLGRHSKIQEKILISWEKKSVFHKSLNTPTHCFYYPLCLVCMVACLFLIRLGGCEIAVEINLQVF